MSTTQTHTIPKAFPATGDISYDMLRSIGMEYIEKLCGSVWTDYNVHDPGITILEVLCYAITDLGYRIDLPIEDLLAVEQDNFQSMHEQFHSAISILPNCPLTENDYRKLFIDIDGINNAWIVGAPKTVFVNCKAPSPMDPDNRGELSYQDFPVLSNEKTQFELQGLCKVYLELDEGADENKAIVDVTDRYHKHRNLCEDLLEVRVIDIQEVRVCAEMELEPEADAETVDALIRLALRDYLMPAVSFHSLAEMQSMGYTTDEIFQGPVLEHGFITDKELENSALRTEVRLSDIIHILMAIDGVKVVRDIHLGFCETDGPLPDQPQWILCIAEGHQPQLCKNSVFNFYKDVLPIQLSKTEAADKLASLLQARRDAMLSKHSEDIPMPLGTYRDFSAVSTIQNEFPDTYGINQNGLPSHVSQLRRAEARQLQAYLRFFDQVIAQYFAHLSKVRVLLSADDTIRKTYFNQVVTGIREGDKLLVSPATHASDVDALTANYDDYAVRKHTLLNHLIARFAERFFEYAFLMREMFGKDIEDALIRNKVVFLKEYPSFSRRRNCAFDRYHEDAGIWNTQNVSGLEHRVARLSGIRDYSRRDLSKTPFTITETVTPGGNEYAWKINLTPTVVLLENHQPYTSEDEARKNMWLASVLAWTSNHYLVIPVATKFEIRIVDKDGNVVAQRPKKYNSAAAAEEAIPEMMQFMYEQMSEEGMYVIEHILLRPDISDPNADPGIFMPVCVEPDCSGCEPLDPYSFRLSVILPGWTERFSDMDFRKFLDRLIRLETPAHILPRICWIGEEQMQEFELVYQEWLIARFSNPDGQVDDPLLQKFIMALTRLHTIYPEGTLHDCEDEGADEDDNPIVLGNTSIGTL